MNARHLGAPLVALLLAASAGALASSARAAAPAPGDSVRNPPPHAVPIPPPAPIPAPPPAGGPAAPPDSATTPPYTPAFPQHAAQPAAPESSAASRAPRPSVGQDRDRIEIGAGVVQGYFNWVGSFGYRRFVTERRGWQQWAMGELTGSHRNDISEGVMSAYYLFRHRRTYRSSARLRPLLEGGPGVHLAIQAARLTPFNVTPFHAHAYIKTHVYGGFELLLSDRTGLVIRGRMSVPNHKPFDYAQAAIFLR